MEIDWSPMPLTRWRDLLAQAPRSTLLQSWSYARAGRACHQLMPWPATIRRGQEVIGLFQLQEVRLGPVHVLHLHRGPLWFDAAPSAQDWAGFLDRLAAAFPSRLGRWRRVMPARADGPETDGLMGAAGFRKKGAPYETIWLDLAPALDTLRTGLKPKWRNALSKAERSGMTVETDRAGRLINWFVSGYAADRARRRYRGPMPAFLRRLMAEAAHHEECWILRAVTPDGPVAGILVLRHGRSATYQAGWTLEDGRAVNAHHRLLWEAIAALKEAGADAFDLGGIHPESAAGVTRFKSGLGGERCTLAGLYA